MTIKNMLCSFYAFKALLQGPVVEHPDTVQAEYVYAPFSVCFPKHAGASNSAKYKYRFKKLPWQTRQVDKRFLELQGIPYTAYSDYYDNAIQVPVYSLDLPEEVDTQMVLIFRNLLLESVPTIRKFEIPEAVLVETERWLNFLYPGVQDEAVNSASTRG